MADIEVSRDHDLGLDGARQAADRMIEALGARFDLRGRWSGDTLRFERPGVSGTLDVSAKDMRLQVTLGFLLKAMRGSIERAVHEELDRLFAQAAPRAKTGPAKPKKGA